MRDARGNVLALTTADAPSFFSHFSSFSRSQRRRNASGYTERRETRQPHAADSFAYFFLPAIAFAGPLRVRALVCVR
ncbi:hypothetical protein BN961_01041 [Afipia felis]|uniref:Uncharacterized protein n=1 Tax=Afipia felis TaxID=1035 RepID=A0A090N6Y1_AFIFE|nr:hypothetical protein BN961_01041 [Afipia felis]